MKNESSGAFFSAFILHPLSLSLLLLPSCWTIYKCRSLQDLGLKILIPRAAVYTRLYWSLARGLGICRRNCAFGGWPGLQGRGRSDLWRCFLVWPRPDRSRPGWCLRVHCRIGRQIRRGPVVGVGGADGRELIAKAGQTLCTFECGARLGQKLGRPHDRGGRQGQVHRLRLDYFYRRDEYAPVCGAVVRAIIWHEEDFVAVRNQVSFVQRHLDGAPAKTLGHFGQFLARVEARRRHGHQYGQPQ